MKDSPPQPSLSLTLAAWFLAVIGWAGVIYLTNFTIPTVGPRWLFFVVWFTALTGTAIPPHNLVALSLSYACFGDVESLFMPSAAHAARLDEIARHRRGLALAIGLVRGGQLPTLNVANEFVDFDEDEEFYAWAVDEMSGGVG